MKMILAALPSIVFGLFTILFTLQQQRESQKNREQDQKQADERSIRASYENYISDVSALLLDRKFNRSNSDHLLHIRVKTLSVLRHVDAQRKRDILLFLYESRLIRKDMPQDTRLNLRGADLSDVQFIGTPDANWELHHLYLPGVRAANIVFRWCRLDYAVFDGAFMSNAVFHYSSIAYLSLHRVHAPDLQMSEIFFFKNDIRDAFLHRFHLNGAFLVLDTVDLSNSDLLDLVNPQPELIDRNILLVPKVILQNTRLPDGSFGPINHSDLVVDGGVETAVSDETSCTRQTKLSLSVV